MKSLDERKSIDDVLTAAAYSESIRSDEGERTAGDDDDDENDDENELRQKRDEVGVYRRVSSRATDIVHRLAPNSAAFTFLSMVSSCFQRRSTSERSFCISSSCS